MWLSGLRFQWRELCLYCISDVFFQYLFGNNGVAPDLRLWPGKPERDLYILVSTGNGEISLLTVKPEKITRRKAYCTMRVQVCFGSLNDDRLRHVTFKWRLRTMRQWPVDVSMTVMTTRSWFYRCQRTFTFDALFWARTIKLIPS